MKPIKVFEDAIGRAGHLVDLYELLHNQRKRRVRSDWAPKVKEVLGWNSSDTIERIDGNNAVLLIRNPDGWGMEHFEHAWLGELLRSAIVGAVSALDRYFHDLLADKLLGALRGTPPKALADVQVSIVDADKMIEKTLESRRGGGSATRSRTILKGSFRRVLNQRTIQGPTQVEQACQMLGISKCWSQIARKLSMDADPVKKELGRIVHRRNKVVHEGDIKQGSRPRAVKLNDIDSPSTRRDIDWLESLVRAVDSIVN